MIKDQTTNFKKFITNLSSVKIDSEQIAEKLINDSIEIYKDGWRHSYSVVTAFIFDRKQIEGARNVLTSINSNLEIIINTLKQKIAQEENSLSDLYQNSVNCYLGLQRLQDHVSLESIRLDYSKSIEKRLNDIKDEAQDKIQELNKFIKETSEKVDDNIKNQKNEAITILGIFTAIIGVIGVGATLSSSIFSNMNDISTWKLYSLTCLIVLFVTNILVLLFDFLRDIAGKKKTENEHNHIWVLNILLIIVSACCFLVSFSDKMPQSQNQPTSAVSCTVNNNSNLPLK